MHHAAPAVERWAKHMRCRKHVVQRASVRTHGFAAHTRPSTLPRSATNSGCGRFFPRCLRLKESSLGFSCCKFCSHFASCIVSQGDINLPETSLCHCGSVWFVDANIGRDLWGIKSSFWSHFVGTSLHKYSKLHASANTDGMSAINPIFLCTEWVT